MINEDLKGNVDCEKINEFNQKPSASFRLEAIR